MRTFLNALRLTALLTLLTGLIYPLAVWGLAQTLFPNQARGSLIMNGNKLVGSKLIGQNFATARYFQSRPSAAGDKGYDASASGGSNLGPTNKALIEGVRMRLKNVLESNPGVSPHDVPIDIVTASASGLDPEISPAAANIQIARVARARSLSEDQVRTIVQENTRGRFAGIVGEPGVNVLQLNLALDKLSQAAPPVSK